MSARDATREGKGRQRGLIHPDSPLTTNPVLKACFKRYRTMVVVQGALVVQLLSTALVREIPMI